MPRRTRSKALGLCPSFGLRPKTLGHSPNQGRSPFPLVPALAGHSPRRTSGGEAATVNRIAFCARPYGNYFLGQSLK